MLDSTNYSLLAHNTFGVAALCRRFVQIESVAEAQAVLPTIAPEARLIIGAGSNLLFTSDVEGTVIRSGIKGMSVVEGDDVLLCCGSGEVWDDVVAYAIAHNLHGAENLSAIPGDVGASAVQNIGAYGSEIADIIEAVEAVEIASGQLFTFDKAACEYGYRSSRFKTAWRNRFFITHVTYRLSRTFTPLLHYGNIQQVLHEQGISTPSAAQLRQIIISIRKEKLPETTVLGSAGSFFMNPIVARTTIETLQKTYPTMPIYDINPQQVKLSAGWLIEQCGWKGRTIGRVGVYDRNALVIVNRGGATGKEILAVAQSIQHDVLERFGIALSTEVNII